MILIYTGNGKGKTTAAIGAAFRMLGHGKKVLMIQFFKGDWPVVFGEMESVKRQPNFEILQIGKGFVGIMGDKKPIEEHKKAAHEAVDIARKKIVSGEYGLVILDEVNVAIDLRLIEPEDLMGILNRTPKTTHLILTGRNAKPELMDRADLVTEMREIKHPYQKGIPAQIGIDY